MGLIFKLIKSVIKCILYVFVFAACLVLIPNLPPYTKFTSIQHEPTQARVGALQQNGVLNNPQKLYEGKLLGAEAFHLYNGELYTSIATGEVLKISPGGHVTFVTKIGQPCTSLTQESKCGRPLGIQIDAKTNQLYVADAYHGIWKVDLKSDRKQLLVSPRVEIEGRQPRLFNSIALANNGDFYWTDSTSDFQLQDGVYSLLADPSGRLFHYNAAKNQSKVLLDDLWFANGVALSPDGQAVVVAETSRYRLLKYYVAGPKKGQSEVFVAGLPGTPDNIQVLPDGSGMLVGLYLTFDDENPLLIKSMGETPYVRKFLARLQRIFELPFEYLHKQFPHVHVLEDLVYIIGHFKSVAPFTPKQSGLVQLDWNGNIVASYFNTDGSLPTVSDGVVFNDKLYTGTPHTQNYIGAVPAPAPLRKAFSNIKVQGKPAEPAKPTTTTPKATTTTPKPTTTTPKPTTTTPKPTTTTPKPTTTTPKPTTTTPKPTTTTPKSTTTTPKPTTTTPKPTTTTPKPTTTTPKPTTTTPKTTTTTKPASAKSSSTEEPTKKTATKVDPKPTTSQESKTQKPAPKPEKKPVPEQIPIKEDIPSDTVRPSEETLKVIKKGGPTEIPVHNV